MSNLEKKLIDQANFGLFFLYASISNKTANRLRKEGFVVTDSHESKVFPRQHKICWRAAGANRFDYARVSLLDEENPQYSFAQKVWIISMKNQPSLKQLYG